MHVYTEGNYERCVHGNSVQYGNFTWEEAPLRTESTWERIMPKARDCPKHVYLYITEGQNKSYKKMNLRSILFT